MAEHYDKDKRPHGETGDTVEQAREVSRSTTTVYPELEKTNGAQVSPDANTGMVPREGTGNGAGRT